MDEGPTVELAPAPQPRRRPRWLLPALLVPIGTLVIMNWTAGVTWSTLAERHPAVLITLSGVNRYLIAASPNLDPVTFYVIGFLRLVVADPLFYVLGLFYGDAALRWLERKMKDGAMVFLWMEKAFEKARYPMVVLAPNNVVCLLAGATQMSPALFVPLNALGTAARLFLIRLFGDAFNAPIGSVTGFFDRWRVPLIGLSAVLLVVFLVQSKGGGLRDLGELKREAEAQEAREGEAP